jgi:hypothetical protein
VKEVISTIRQMMRISAPIPHFRLSCLADAYFGFSLSAGFAAAAFPDDAFIFNI